MLFGSANGYFPGITFDGLHVPLNPDGYSTGLARQIVPVLLNGNGAETFSLTLLPGSALTYVGLTPTSRRGRLRSDQRNAQRGELGSTHDSGAVIRA